MKLPIIYGVVFGLLSGFFKYSQFEHRVIDTFPFFFLFASIVLCTIHYKKLNPGIKSFSYKECTRLGVLVVLISSIVISIYTFYYFSYQYPGFIDDELEEAKIELMKTTPDIEIVSSKINKLKEDNTVGKYIFNVFTANLVIGMILSFVLSFFLRKNMRVVN